MISRKNSLERVVGNGMQCNCRPCVCEPNASGAEVGDRGGTKGPGDLCRIHKGLALFFAVEVCEMAIAKSMTNPQPKRLSRRA